MFCGGDCWPRRRLVAHLDRPWPGVAWAGGTLDNERPGVGRPDTRPLCLGDWPQSWPGSTGQRAEPGHVFIHAEVAAWVGPGPRLLLLPG